MPSHTLAAAAEPRATRSTYLSGLLLAGFGAVFFSAKAIVAKLLYAQGLDAVGVIALRMLLSTTLFLAIALCTQLRSPRLSRRDLLRVALLGFVGYYASSMLDFMGLEYISAGLERLILFLMPTFLLLLGLLVFGRKVTPAQWLSMGFAYAGIVLVFWHDVAIAARRSRSVPAWCSQRRCSTRCTCCTRAS